MSSLLIVILIGLFVPVATGLLRYAAIRQNEKLYYFSVAIVSAVTILFGKQATSIATAIGFNFIRSPLTNSLHNGQYASFIGIAVLFLCSFWYILYPIGLIGKAISLVLLILSWIAIKYDSYVNNFISGSIHRSYPIYQKMLVKLTGILVIVLLNMTGKHKEYLRSKISKTTMTYLFSKKTKK